MMKKQRLFPLLLAILLFVPLLGGASASEASESETSAPVGEAFSTTEYVLNRDDDYYHFSSVTDVQIRGYIGGDLIGFSYAPKVSETNLSAVRWAWEKGLIAEDECVWYPTQAVSRAQIALLLMRYDQLIGASGEAA